MPTKTGIRVSFGAASLVASVAHAHHAFTNFDLNASLTLTGILTKIDARNSYIEVSIDS